MRRRPALFGSLAAVIAVAAAVFLLLARGPAREPDPDPLAPHAYRRASAGLDPRQRGLRAGTRLAGAERRGPPADWPSDHRKETHEGIRYAIECSARRATSTQAGFATATEMKQLLARRDLTSLSPDVSLVQGRLGLVRCRASTARRCQ